MQKTPFVIVGTGAEARMALDIAQALDVLVYGFITTEADFEYQELNDISVIGDLDHDDSKTLLAEDNVRFVIVEGDPDKRADLVEQISRFRKDLGDLRHPQSLISSYVALGSGNIIHAGVVIQPNVEVGSHNLLHPYVTIDPDGAVGDYCTFQTGVKVGREVIIEDDVFIGAGAILYPGIKVGKGAMIAAGSVVLKDVGEGSKVFGNPAQAE